MAQRLILSIVLQDIIKNKDGMPAAGYWMYFYDKKSPTTLRSAYYKNQEGNVVPAPNPLQLDENGALPHKLYYFVDVDDPEDRYTVEMKCRYGNAVVPELIFQDLPYFQEQAKSDPITAVVSDNLFIDGQFNIGIKIDDRGQGAGYVLPAFPQLPIAGLSWQFLRPYADSVPIQNRTDVDRIFIKEINEAEKISEGNPRFYLNVICEKFSAPLQKIIAFKSSNVLWGAATSVQLKFYAWKSGDDIPVTVSVVRNFGSKSSAAPQVIQIDKYTIDSDTPKVYFARFSLPEVIIPPDIGDDQYLLLQFLLPVDQVFDFRITNCYCAKVSSPVSVVDFNYPVQNSDLAKSNLLFSSFPATKYSIRNSYNELIFTVGGLKFADNVGEIVRYPKGAKVNAKEINLIKCDGRTLDSREISPLGIEYKRLYEKLDYAPIKFDMLKTEDIPNWFNAISSSYIRRFVADHNVKVAFSGKGVVNPKPEGNDIGHLWLETTFHANTDVGYNFQYAAAASSVDLTTCCHSFDITTYYWDAEIVATSYYPKEVRFANSTTNFPGYFQSVSYSDLIYKFPSDGISYKQGIDIAVKKTKANYSVKNGFFYLTINLGYDVPYPSGARSLYNPVYFNSRVYDIVFPLIIPNISCTFLQKPYYEKNKYYYGTSQNYFLFSPWHVKAMSTIHGSYNTSAFEPEEIRLYSFRNNTSPVNPLIKSWGNHGVYKLSPTERRIPGKPNVLFHDKNSVITYAMQHKALFTQRCLYVLKFKEVKAGDWIGLKTYNNTKTGNNFDTVVWWSVDGQGKAPTKVTAKEFKEIKVTKGTTTEQLADMVASGVNDNRKAYEFNVPNITDTKYDHYIKY
ncbi:hypothetical protein [Wolbachia endosymbiont of Cantharis cryptica]|uniref:hypothetical protein n=1 Tax=Wolbachia endosymbiont of Cantharis cryptica TaxID=3066132 RepID=UPI00376EE26A